jgi:Zn-dependent protease with chaperone function
VSLRTPDNARFRALERARDLALLWSLLLGLGLLIGVASLRIAPAPAGQGWLGYVWGFEPISLTTGLLLCGYAAFTSFALRRRVRLGAEGEGVTTLHPRGGPALDRQIGSMTGREIVDTVRELARELGVGRIDRVQLIDRPDPNAFTASWPGVGSFVAIHSNVLELLPRACIRAVLAHEVGHVRRRDSIAALVTHLPASGARFLLAWAGIPLLQGLLGAADLAEFVRRLAGCGVALVAWQAASRVVARSHGGASQRAELVADAYAALACGWTTHLNALLLIADRVEALSAVAAALRDLPERIGQRPEPRTLLAVLNLLPRGGIDRKAAIEAAPRLFVKERLLALRAGLGLPLDDANIDDLAARAAETFREKLAMEKENEAAERRAEGKPEPVPSEEQGQAAPSDDAHWRRFDVDNSGHLDVAEARVMVESLRGEPNRMCFRDPLEGVDRLTTHPPMRARILSVADVFDPR